jgi:outer membrane lipoprotein SlyB
VSAEGQFKGSGHDRRDTVEQGGGTAGGMLIGGLIGGGPGVLIGGAVGATSTTVHWLTKHRSATLPAGTQLTLELNRPLTMTTAVANGGSK